MISLQKMTAVATLGIMLGVASPVLAESAAVTPKVASRAGVNQDTIISRLKTKADKEIDRRVSALTKLIDRINAIKRLTGDQKTSLTSEVQDEINNLNTLKTKIDADTDLATLRIDIQSIVKDYRIFALFIPKTYIIVHADRLLDIVDDMTQVQNKLQARIDAAKTGGADTTSMQNAITDMAAKLADAKKQAQGAIDAVVPLTPSGYPGNRTTLMSARTMLQTARQDIQAAHRDVQTIRQALVRLGVRVNAKITPVSTKSAAPKPTESTESAD